MQLSVVTSKEPFGHSDQMSPRCCRGSSSLLPTSDRRHPQRWEFRYGFCDKHIAELSFQLRKLNKIKGNAGLPASQRLPEESSPANFGRSRTSPAAS